MLEDLIKSNVPAGLLHDVQFLSQRVCLGLLDRYLDPPSVTRSKEVATESMGQPIRKKCGSVGSRAVVHMI